MIFIQKTISATFENRDAAEMALLKMRLDNIPILKKSMVSINNTSAKHDFFYMAPIYSTHRSDTSLQGVTPIPLIKNFLPPVNSRLINDVVPKDVRLEIRVTSDQSGEVKNKLRSCHGYNVTDTL